MRSYPLYIQDTITSLPNKMVFTYKAMIVSANIENDAVRLSTEDIGAIKHFFKIIRLLNVCYFPNDGNPFLKGSAR